MIPPGSFMIDPDSPHLVVAGFHLIPALVWALVAYRYWVLGRSDAPQTLLFRILPLLTGLQAVHYGAHVCMEMTPTELGGRAAGLHPALQILISLSLVATAVLFRHLVLLLAIREQRPSRRWLALNYGTAALVVLALIASPLVPERIVAAPGVAARAIAGWYGAVMMGLGIFEIYRLARRGIWPRHFHVAFGATFLGAVALLGLGDVLLSMVLSGSDAAGTANMSVLVHTSVGLATAAPFALGVLGEFLRSLVLTVTGISVAGAAVFLFPGALASLANEELRDLLRVVTTFGLLLLFVPGSAWLRGVIDRVVFRHNRRCHEELRTCLVTLPLELGTGELGRRALAELARIMGLTGAALLLTRARVEAVVHGDLAFDELRRVWPRGARGATLPTRPFGLYWLRDGTLREALATANVVLVVPVHSPRGPWGHLFITTGLLSQATSEEHLETLAAFADELALLLDACELLARAVAVERSLAHAEKLAAVGEVAARIAHEIRNPVTAARSLAQQLAREAMHAGEHRLILEELDRVERQVQALLRYARRETFELRPVDVGASVRETVAGFEGRFEEAGVALALDTEESVVVSADAEKLRQVVVNLVENAIDALGAVAPDERRLEVSVRAADGRAVIRVADSGVGVPPEALPRLFEPFFSLKPQGTGLGLAIAKRTIEAHGGRIEASSPAGSGLEIAIALPLLREAQ
jgi:signal transduction histidine kinase